MAVVKYLQQNVENIRVGLLYLVQQDAGVGLAPDGLRQLAAFLIADIARRRSHQAGDGELLHILRHIQPDEGILTAEHELGQRPGQLRFADTGRSQEDEVANGTPGIF